MPSLQNGSTVASNMVESAAEHHDEKHVHFAEGKAFSHTKKFSKNSVLSHHHGPVDVHKKPSLKGCLKHAHSGTNPPNGSLSQHQHECQCHIDNNGVHVDHMDVEMDDASSSRLVAAAAELAEEKMAAAQVSELQPAEDPETENSTNLDTNANGEETTQDASESTTSGPKKSKKKRKKNKQQQAGHEDQSTNKLEDPTAKSQTTEHMESWSSASSTTSSTSSPTKFKSTDSNTSSNANTISLPPINDPNSRNSNNSKPSISSNIELAKQRKRRVADVRRENLAASTSSSTAQQVTDRGAFLAHLVQEKEREHQQRVLAAMGHDRVQYYPNFRRTSIGEYDANDMDLALLMSQINSPVPLRRMDIEPPAVTAERKRREIQKKLRFERLPRYEYDAGTAGPASLRVYIYEITSAETRITFTSPTLLQLHFPSGERLLEFTFSDQYEPKGSISSVENGTILIMLKRKTPRLGIARVEWFDAKWDLESCTWERKESKEVVDKTKKETTDKAKKKSENTTNNHKTAASTPAAQTEKLSESTRKIVSSSQPVSNSQSSNEAENAIEPKPKNKVLRLDEVKDKIVTLPKTIPLPPISETIKQDKEDIKLPVLDEEKSPVSTIEEHQQDEEDKSEWVQATSKKPVRKNNATITKDIRTRNDRSPRRRHRHQHDSADQTSHRSISPSPVRQRESKPTRTVQPDSPKGTKSSQKSEAQRKKTAEQETLSVPPSNDNQNLPSQQDNVIVKHQSLDGAQDWSTNSRTPSESSAVSGSSLPSGASTPTEPVSVRTATVDETPSSPTNPSHVVQNAESTITKTQFYTDNDSDEEDDETELPANTFSWRQNACLAVRNAFDGGLSFTGFRSSISPMSSSSSSPVASLCSSSNNSVSVTGVSPANSLTGKSSPVLCKPHLLDRLFTRFGCAYAFGEDVGATEDGTAGPKSTSTMSESGTVSPVQLEKPVSPSKPSNGTLPPPYALTNKERRRRLAELGVRFGNVEMSSSGSTGSENDDDHPRIEIQGGRYTENEDEFHSAGEMETSSEEDVQRPECNTPQEQHEVGSTDAPLQTEQTTHHPQLPSLKHEKELDQLHMVDSGYVEASEENIPVMSDQKTTQDLQDETDEMATDEIVDIELNTQKDKWASLFNMGNTCYLNNIIQCIVTIEPFASYFLSNRYIPHVNTTNKDGSGGVLVREFAALTRHLWLNEASTTPRQFKWALISKYRDFQGYAQQDAQEFLAILLDTIHEDLNDIHTKPFLEYGDYDDNTPDDQIADAFWNIYKKRNDSLVVDMFTGQYKSRVQCLTCNKVSIKFDECMYLSVDIPEPPVDISLLVTTKTMEIRKVRMTLKRTDKLINMLKYVSERLKISAENLLLCMQRHGAIVKVADEDDLQRSVDEVLQVLGMMIIVERDPSQAALCVRHEFPWQESIDKFRRPHLSSEYPQPWIMSIPARAYKVKDLYRYIHLRLRSYFKEDPSLIKNDRQPFFLSFMSDGDNYEDEDVDVQYNLETVVDLSRQSQLKVALKWRSKEVFERFYDMEAESPLSIDEDGNSSDQKVAGIRRDTSSPSPAVVTIYQCIDSFTTAEDLPEDAYYCSKCKVHQRSRKKLDLYKLPDVLIIHLKRFKAHPRYMDHFVKIDTPVEYPLELDLSDRVLGENDDKFELFAVSNHIGSMTSGHYTAFAKRGDKWFEFDDEDVRPVSENDVVTSMAYVLFYKRKT